MQRSLSLFRKYFTACCNRYRFPIWSINRLEIFYSYDNLLNKFCLSVFNKTVTKYLIVTGYQFKNGLDPNLNTGLEIGEKSCTSAGKNQRIYVQSEKPVL